MCCTGEVDARDATPVVPRLGLGGAWKGRPVRRDCGSSGGYSRRRRMRGPRGSVRVSGRSPRRRPAPHSSHSQHHRLHCCPMCTRRRYPSSRRSPGSLHLRELLFRVLPGVVALLVLAVCEHEDVARTRSVRSRNRTNRVVTGGGLAGHEIRVVEVTSGRDHRYRARSCGARGRPEDAESGGCCGGPSRNSRRLCVIV